MPCGRVLPNRSRGRLVLDLHVEPGVARLLLDDLLGQLTPLVLGRGVDRDRGGLAVLGPDAAAVLLPAVARHERVDLVQVQLVHHELRALSWYSDWIGGLKLFCGVSTPRSPNSRFDDGLAVDRVGERLAHRHRVERELVVVHPERLGVRRLRGDLLLRVRQTLLDRVDRVELGLRVDREDLTRLEGLELGGGTRLRKPSTHKSHRSGIDHEHHGQGALSAGAEGHYWHVRGSCPVTSAVACLL